MYEPVSRTIRVNRTRNGTTFCQHPQKSGVVFLGEDFWEMLTPAKRDALVVLLYGDRREGSYRIQDATTLEILDTHTIR